MLTNEANDEKRIVPIASAAVAAFQWINEKIGLSASILKQKRYLQYKGPYRSTYRFLIAAMVTAIFLFDPVMVGSALKNPSPFLGLDSRRNVSARQNEVIYHAIDNSAFDNLQIDVKDMTFMADQSLGQSINASITEAFEDLRELNDVDNADESSSAEKLDEPEETEENQTVVTKEEIEEDEISLPPYYHIILKVADRYDIDPALIRAVIMVESSNNPNAVSRRGAKGLMQLMPGTAKELGVEDLFDPEHNVDGGTRYLHRMISRFNGDIKLGLAAYNAGSRHVLNYGGVPPFKETQRYVKKVLAHYESYKVGM